MREEMERNPKIVMWGEDIADPKGGVFGVTRGLTNQYPDRVQNSPLAEASIVGVAGGMAIGGLQADCRNSIRRLFLARLHANAK